MKFHDNHNNRDLAFKIKLLINLLQSKHQLFQNNIILLIALIKLLMMMIIMKIKIRFNFLNILIL